MNPILKAEKREFLVGDEAVMVEKQNADVISVGGGRGRRERETEVKRPTARAGPPIRTWRGREGAAFRVAERHSRSVLWFRRLCMRV